MAGVPARDPGNIHGIEGMSGQTAHLIGCTAPQPARSDRFRNRFGSGVSGGGRSGVFEDGQADPPNLSIGYFLHRKSVIAPVQRLMKLGHPTQLIHQEAGQGGIGFIARERLGEIPVELPDRQQAFERILAWAQPVDGEMTRIAHPLDLTDDFFEHIIHGHHAFELSEFIYNHSELDAGAPELPENVVDGGRFRDKGGRADQLP